MALCARMASSWSSRVALAVVEFAMPALLRLACSSKCSVWHCLQWRLKLSHVQSLADFFFQCLVALVRQLTWSCLHLKVGHQWI